jgi:hypothetical protein
LTPSQRATWFAATPPAAVNAPPTARSPLPSTASELTVHVAPLMPVPSPDHVLPFHFISE